MIRWYVFSSSAAFITAGSDRTVTLKSLGASAAWITRHTDGSSSSTRMRTSLERYSPLDASAAQPRGRSVGASESASGLAGPTPLLARMVITGHSSLGPGVIIGSILGRAAQGGRTAG